MLSTKHFFRFICAVLFVSVLASCCYAVDVTPFFKIYEDYMQNPFKVEKKWTDEVITIEGTVRHMKKNKDGIPVVLCWRPKPGGRRGDVVYFIGFDPENPPERLFDLTEAQTAKFRGPVVDIKEGDNNDLVIYMLCFEILD